MPQKETVSRNDAIRHSLAHLLAMAVLKKFPKAKLGIGPVIENGFYYDFKLPRPLTPEDLKDLKRSIREYTKMNLPISGRKITGANAKKMFKDQPFKLELIKDFTKEKKPLSIYTTGTPPRSSSPYLLFTNQYFVDLCKGGHVKNTKEINPEAFVLEKTAGAYWKGDEKNPQLTRIYGIAFGTKKELDEYLTLLEEARKRDHKKLGSELDLFMFHPTAPGMPYWLPKGVVIYNELINFWRKEHTKRNYQEIVSPILNKKELYITSGHYEHYWQDMFVAKTDEAEEYGIKAMNCPNAMIVFGSKLRSYKDLPLRFSDTDSLHRNELSGTLNGLLRVREFRQDDAHIFVPEEEIGAEYKRIFEIVERFYSIFGMSYVFRLGTRPKSFMGNRKTWDKAEATLKRILRESKKEYSIMEGDGAFYGPKVDILMKDTLKREWQMGTIQLDFQQPERFKLGYITEDGSRKTPVAIHRVIYGSLERFIGILIEHFAGAFPVWLSPVQTIILPISEKFKNYAETIAEELKRNDLRVEISNPNETLGKRIRESELQKIPYLLIVGEKEEKAKTVSIRHPAPFKARSAHYAEKEISLPDLLEKMKKEIADKII
jgi:threonyl-tRNA synthetase